MCRAGAEGSTTGAEAWLPSWGGDEGLWKGGGGARQRGVVCGGSRGYEVDSVNSATRTKRWADMTMCGDGYRPHVRMLCVGAYTTADGLQHTRWSLGAGRRDLARCAGQMYLLFAVAFHFRQIPLFAKTRISVTPESRSRPPGPQRAHLVPTHPPARRNTLTARKNPRKL